MAKSHALLNVLSAIETANDVKGLTVKVYGQDGLLELNKQTVGSNSPGNFGSRFGLTVNGKTIVGSRSDSTGAYKVQGAQPIDDNMSAKYCRFRPADIAAIIYNRVDNQGLIASEAIKDKPNLPKPVNTKAIKRTPKTVAKKSA